jgi:hypothetical protein
MSKPTLPNVLPVLHQMWKDPTFSAVVKGQQVVFKNLTEARERAAKEGYTGIKVVR